MVQLLPAPNLGDVTLRHEAIAAGYTDRDLAKLVRSGDLVKLRHGAYASGDQWRSLTPEGQHRLVSRAVVRQANTEIVLSHGSAVPEYDGPRWGLPQHQVDVTRIDRRAGRNSAGVRQHQGLLLPEDVERRAGVLVTSGTRTAIDITTVADVERSLVVVNYLLHARFTTPGAIQDRYAAMDHHPNTLASDLVFRLADPRIESVAESRAFYMFWRQHVPMPEPQIEITDGRGNVVAALDFGWRERKAWLEVDGMSKYLKFLREGETAADAVMREKRREDLVRELTGWRCMRITYDDLRHAVQTSRRILRFLGR